MANKEYFVMQSIGHDRREFISKNFCLAGTASLSAFGVRTAAAQAQEARTVFVNSHGVTSVNRRAPYGGVKQSGIGRKTSIEGVLEYMQLQTITTHGEF